MNVPFLDLKAQHAPLRADILAAWGDILDNAGFVGGKYVASLESGLATASGTAHACAVSNGTEALALALRALGVGSGDEVILPGNTFIATAEAVSLCGATPVFVDCLAGTWNLDPAAIGPAVTARTKGVIGVHLYGQPFDVDACQTVCDRHGLWLMEDNAQGILATYKGKPTGGLARVAATSFYPGKNLGACGEGGAVMTSDTALDAAVRRLREHGQAAKYYHDVVGTNARLASIQAAALHVKLPHLPSWTEARRRNARQYLERLSDVPGVRVPEVAAWADPVWHLFVVHVANRDAVLASLQAAGVGAALHYPVPCHLQKAYAHLGHARGRLPHAEYNASHCLSLPMFPELTEAQIDYVCQQLRLAVLGAA
ncbi:MAG: DegT/DnrJ/EryC1/StrS family aminotransferase [Deltaproteobacteria bacterium]|nr:DegT/DnrJ/EryC1/StrS family aminotransferase [Deltaproteobacteria bacterium]